MGVRFPHARPFPSVHIPVSATKFLGLFEGPQDYARLHDLSPAYVREIQSKIAAWLRQLGRAPQPNDMQALSRQFAINLQDVAMLVKQISTVPGNEIAQRAMVPESK